VTFKPSVWYPIAVLLSVVNVVAVWFATGPTPPWHATIHAALAVGFGSWAYRLRQRRGGSARQVGPEAVEALDALEALEADMSTLRQELSETRERLNFAERMLAREAESRRVGPQR
jgi:hypothetical protein